MIVQSQEKLIRDYVAIATVDEIYFIKMNDIIFCKSEGRYTNFYLQNGKVSISSKNIGDYEIFYFIPFPFFDCLLPQPGLHSGKNL
jgi:hypothetical protein